MRRKIIIGLLTVYLLALLVGCESIRVEQLKTDTPMKKSTKEKDYKDKDEYIDKISTTRVNISVDGSLRNMRTVAETGEISLEMREELKKSNTFFQCLVDDFSNLNIPKDFVDYNEEILTYLKKAKESLVKLEALDNKEDIKKYADEFISDNRQISSIIDKVLLYFAGC